MTSRIPPLTWIVFAFFSVISASHGAVTDAPPPDPEHDDVVFAQTFLKYHQTAFPEGLRKAVIEDQVDLSALQIDLIQVAVLTLMDNNHHHGVVARTAVLAALSDSLVVIPECFSAPIERRLQDNLKSWKRLLESHEDLIRDARHPDPGSPRLDNFASRMAVYHWFAAAAMTLKEGPETEDPDAIQILMQGGLSMKIEDFLAFPEEIRHPLLLYYFRVGLRLVGQRFGGEDQSRILASIHRTFETARDPRLPQIAEAIEKGDLAALERIWNKDKNVCRAAAKRRQPRGGFGTGGHPRKRRS